MRYVALLLLVTACAAPVATPAPPVCPTASTAPAASAQAPAVTVTVRTVRAKIEKLEPEAALVRVLTAKTVEADWFAPVFLDKVSASQVTSLVAQLTKDLGALHKVEKSESGYRAVFANGTVPSRIHLDGDGRIDGLFFAPPEATKPRPLAEVVAELGTLPGKVSVLVTTGSHADAELVPDEALAVGSAFKLAILAVIKERVDAKKLAWTQLVSLEPRHKSLPSGFLQTWPDGAPLTLHSLASLMISQSDNTATDVLLDLAGRSAVEKLAPDNAPFLATREAFVLKGKGGAELLAKWRAEGEPGRRRLLTELAKAPLPPASDFEGEKVTAPDIEWRFSARHLCELLAKTKDLPMLHINPGVATKKDWDAIAFKGGSETGVLNLSTIVEKSGKQHCVVATWNAEKPLEEGRFFSLYQQLLTATR